MGVFFFPLQNLIFIVLLAVLEIVICSKFSLISIPVTKIQPVLHCALELSIFPVIKIVRSISHRASKFPAFFFLLCLMVTSDTEQWLMTKPESQGWQRLFGNPLGKPKPREEVTELGSHGHMIWGRFAKEEQGCMNFGIWLQSSNPGPTTCYLTFLLKHQYSHPQVRGTNCSENLVG